MISNMKYRHFLSIVCVLLFGVGSVFGQNNTIKIPDVSVEKGKFISLPVNMDNTADVVAVQFTLTVPSGLTLNTATAALTDRSDDHTVTLQSVGNNKYMAMIFSSKNKAIKGRTGKLMSVSLAASNSLAEGTVHQLTLSDVVIGAPDGSNLATGFNAGKVTITKSPDFEVSHVVANETNVNPGGKVNVNWKVSNIGGLPTTGGWSEQILLANEQGTTKLLGTLYNDDILNAGGAVSRNTELNVPAIIGLDGDCHVVVKVVPNSDSGEPSWLRENNVSQTANTVNVKKELSLSPDNVNIDEANAKTIRFQLSRSGNTTSDEVFALTRNEDSRIVLPESITIEKGMSSVYFYAQVVANKVLDNDSIVGFVISGNNYPEASSKIRIEDDTYPSLSISTDAQDVTEGGSISFKVATQRASKNDVEVKMTCDFSSRFKIPSNIIIPAGQTNVEVNVEAIEDDVPNVEEVVTFTVAAAKHNSASVYTVLVDNDVPTLQLEITPNAVSESAGPLAVTAKLRRTDNINKVVTVKLSDDSNGDIYYGRQTIVMEKGIEEVTVNLGPIDNAVVDGERTYNISAAVWIASCSCNANNGTSGGVVSVPLTVYDNDGPTLTMMSSASVLKEGSEMTVTVKRNTDVSQQMVVNLSSDHNDDMEFPSAVVIPSGEIEVSFTVKSKGNEITGDGYTATLNASAEGYATGYIWFTVSDQTLPDAQIVDFNVSSDQVEVGGSITVEAVIANTGSYELPELTKVGIYTSNSSAATATIYLQNPLQVGEQVLLTRTITMPSSIGTYNVYAVVNDGNGVKELSNSNNSSKILTVKTVSPYTVSVHSDKSVYKSGEKTVISGSITGFDVAEKEVEVYIINDNYRHTIATKTDKEGLFTVEYEPYSGQMGHFIAGACYPLEGLRTEMLAFDYYGVKRVSNAAITCEALLGDTYLGRYTISNPGNLPLSNVSVDVVSKPENCDVKVKCVSSVNANSTFNVEYEIFATSVSEGNSWQQIELNLTTSEGVSLPTTLYYYCRNKQGQLKTDIACINTTMIKGASRDYPFIITNTGKGGTGKITLDIPSWMRLVTPREMASLAYGDSATVILRLTPTDDMQLNVPVSGSIGLNCTNGKGLSLPFNIEPVSESTGSLVIDVCDENTYYTEEKPHVAGASVIVTHPITGAIVTSGTTGEDGMFKTVLPEGYYTVSVSASGHNSYRNNLLVDPGVENLTTVNLSVEAITIDLKVEETTVQDEYSIVTTLKYETNVPVPVVELSIPQRVDAKSLPEGESLIFYATLTNKGLITAEDVQFLLPEGFHALQFEALAYAEPFNLAPMQSVSIPVKVTHTNSAFAKSASRVRPIDDDPCVGQPGTLYYWDCGNDRKWHRYDVALQLGSCNSKDSLTWNNSSNGIYGGGINGNGWKPTFGPNANPNIGGGGVYFGSSSSSSNVSTIQDEGCEPCQNDFAKELFKCAGKIIPVVGDIYQTIETTLNVFQCLNSAIQNFRMTESNEKKIVGFMKDCPYTEEFADIAQTIFNVVYIFKSAYDDIVKEGNMSTLSNLEEREVIIRTKTSSDLEERKAQVHKRLLDAFDELEKRVVEELQKEGVNYIKGKFKENYPEYSKIIDQSENLVDKIFDLKKVDKTDGEKVTNAVCNVVISIGNFLEKIGYKKVLGKKLVKVAGKVNKYACIAGLATYTCDKEGTEAKAALKSLISSVNKRANGINNSAVDDMLETAEYFMQAVEAEEELRMMLYGDSVWLDVSNFELYPIQEIANLSEDLQPSPLMYMFKPASVSHEQFDNLLDRWNRLFNIDGGYVGLIDLDRIVELNESLKSVSDYLIREHSTSLEDLLKEKIDKAIESIEQSNSSVCASITLQFSQKMVMTRQAFRGTLTVFNGNETTAMSNVKLSLMVKDEEGNVAMADKFQVNPESLKGFEGKLNFEEGWTLDALQTGVATVMFIPTKNAAPTVDKRYSFAGSLSYVDPFTGLTVTRELTPVTLTVKPSPNLDLTYFMQRDILGDDPLTEEIEPSEEAEFALLINNTGYGDATDVRMFTKQPEIVDNEKGLLIDFELISSQLNGGEKTLALGGSVATDFGTIPAKSTSYAQWWIKSSLLGHFTNYNVEATHVTSYGNPDLSLLNDTIPIHELIRSLEVNNGTEKLVGFMTNDIVDAEDMPDMLYLSDGEIETVSLINSSELQKLSSEEYLLRVKADKQGWNYGNITDPTYGRLTLKSIIRKSDGAVVPLRNFWQTDRTLRDGKDPLYENKIHFADYLSSTDAEEYLLTFGTAPEIVLEVERIDGVPEMGNVVDKPVEALSVVFNKNIVSESFTSDDIVVTVQGEEKNSDLILISKESDDTFTLDLTQLNAVSGNGYYTLTVNTADITDVDGFMGKNGKMVSWILYDPTGIDEVNTYDANRPVRVYSITGTLMSNGTSKKLGSVLPKGVYIINGKKRVITH